MIIRSWRRATVRLPVVTQRNGSRVWTRQARPPATIASSNPSYDAVYKRLIRAVDMFDVSSSFAMEQIK